MTNSTTDPADREANQRPETEEQRQLRLRGIWRHQGLDRRERAERLLAGLELSPHVLQFAEESSQIMRQADGGGAGLGEDGVPVGPLNKHQQEMCERVVLCKRVNELREAGTGYVVIPEGPLDEKEDARPRRVGSKMTPGY